MRKVLIFASVAVCLLFLTSTASASWWNVNWKYRREITITNVNGTLTDYQILVELNSSNFNFSHAQENGSDIRFVASDDETLLNHWIEVWNSSNHSAKIWVNVSEITEGTKIFMYYGNENASDASNVNATFIRVIEGVVGAWHFNEGSGTIAHDTSGEENDGTIYGANWTDGKFGKTLEFDGVDDYVEVPDSASLNLANKSFSWSVWLKRDEMDKNQLVIGQGTGEINKGLIIGFRSNNKFTFAFWGNDLNTPDAYTDTTNWHFWAGTYDAATNSRKIYRDGILVANDTASEDYQGSGVIGIGGGGTVWSTNYFNGTIDEVCIYNRTLSEEEISDLYNNYGYTTPNYPNKVLVRKYTESEPVAIVGEEVPTVLSGVGKLIKIEKEIGANYILWKWSCTNPDALVDVFVDGVEVQSAVSGVSGEYLLTDVNENELHIIKIANSFNASDYVRDEARTLPPFSFFLALLLTTFVLLVITFATTSTVRVIASIFTLLFTAFTYKYSIYYASPLSYLLLFAFFFTFALMLVEVLRMLTSTIRKRPKWEEDFWNEWEEGGGGI